MAALACDFHFLASRVTTGCSAVFFAVLYIAQARYVRALLVFLIRHFGSFLSRSLPPTPSRLVHDVAPLAVPTKNESRVHSDCSSHCGYVISTECMQLSKLWPRASARLFKVLWFGIAIRGVSSVSRLIARRYFDGAEAIFISDRSEDPSEFERPHAFK
jgi:hypothetical protein